MLLLLLVVLLTLITAHLAVAAVLPNRPCGERLVAVGVCTTMAIQVHMLALSQLPVTEPLRALPVAHLLLTVGILGLALRHIGVRAAGAALRELLPVSRATTSPWGVGGLLALAALVAVLTATLGWGQLTAPSGVDELAYHVPQAVHIIQDGMVGRPDNYLPWIFAYPQGASMLWAWSMSYSSTDQGFHAVQVAFGAQAVVAVYVLARRSGARQAPALLAALMLASAPIFFRLTTTSTADMCFTAGTLTMITFLAPSRPGQQAADLRLVLLGFAQAASAKIPVLAVLLGGALLLHLLWRNRSLLTLRAVRPGLRLLPDLAVVVALGAGLSTYAVNTWTYGNPMWPLGVHLAGQELEGPLEAFTDASIGAQTSWGDSATMSRAEHWAASFFDWTQPLTEDSLGSFGAAVGLLALPLSVVALVVALRRRDSWILTLAATCAAAMVAVPVLFVPRYGLPAVAVTIAMAAIGLSRLRRVPTVAMVIMVTLALASTLPSARLAAETARWYALNADDEAWWVDRGRSVAEKHRLNDPRSAPAPELVRYIRREVGEGELLVWNITGYPTLMWNRDFSNTIRFLQGSAREDYPIGPSAALMPTQQEIAEWMGEVERLAPDHVVVYRDSAYAAALRSSGWEVVHVDPPENGSLVAVVLQPGS